MVKTIVVDLDGTVADCSHRLVHIEGLGKKDWPRFHRECKNDKPIHKMIFLIAALQIADKDLNVIFCTGRPESSREESEKWITKYMGIVNPVVLMRPEENYREDKIVKPNQLLSAGYTPDKVWFILEDRAKVVKAWRAHGYTCLQCAAGDY